MNHNHPPRQHRRAPVLALALLLILSASAVMAGSSWRAAAAQDAGSAAQQDYTIPIKPSPANDDYPKPLPTDDAPQARPLPLPLPTDDDAPQAGPPPADDDAPAEPPPADGDAPAELTETAEPQPELPPEATPDAESTEEAVAPPAEILPSLVATGRCGGNNEYVFDIRNEGVLPVSTSWKLVQDGQVIDSGPVDLKAGGMMQVRRFLSGTVTLRLSAYGKPYASSPTVTCSTPECPIYGPFPQTRAWDGGADTILLVANGPVSYRAEGKFPPDNNREFMRRTGTLNDGQQLVITYPPGSEWGAASPDGMHESHVRVFLKPVNNSRCDTVSYDWDRYWGEQPVEPTPVPPTEPAATTTPTPDIPPTLQPASPTPTSIPTEPPAPTSTLPAPTAAPTSTPPAPTAAPTEPPPTQTYTPAPTATWGAPLETGGGVCPDWIVYHTDQTGDIEIFRLGPLPAGKTGDVNLTRGVGAVDIGPSLSPDREWIAFSSTRDGNWEIYVSAVAADDIRRITFTPGATESSPTWSPNGRYLAFVSDRDENNELYMVDLYTGELTRLTDNLDDDRHPFWSPDSRKLIFTNDSSGAFQLVELDIASGQLEQRSTGGLENVIAPLYSFDGRFIAFRTQATSAANSVLYVMNADGSAVRQVSDAGGSTGTASWSPDSSLIAYSSDLDGDLDVYVYDVAAGTTRLLTDNAVADYSPTWICNSNTVVFTSSVRETPEIFSHHALPIDAPPIDVGAEASQLTDSPYNNVVPEGMPALRMGL